MTPPRLTIALDIDNTLVDTTAAIGAYVYAKFGLYLNPSQQKQYNLMSLLDTVGEIDPALLTRIKMEVLGLTLRDGLWYFNAVHPLPGAKLAVNRLAEHFRLIAITSRPVSLRAITTKCLLKDFPAIESIHHTKSAYKGRTGKAQRASYAVDDHHEAVKAYAGQRIKTFYLQAPYSPSIQGRERKRVTVVSTVLEASEILLRQFQGA